MAQQIITNNSIRLFLMDRPEFNTLIDGVRFSDEMINEAVLNIVDAFNIMNPPSNVFYTVETFPSRYLLLMGVAGYLLKSASINEAANAFTYSADGVSVVDKDKERAQQFMAIGGQMSAEFKETAQNIKTNQNIAQCYGTVYSEYINRLYTT